MFVLLKHILQNGIRTIYYDTLYDNYTMDQLSAISRLISSTNANIVNVNTGNTYMKELINNVL